MIVQVEEEKEEEEEGEREKKTKAINLLEPAYRRFSWQ